jgi:hypothetical protein
MATTIVWTRHLRSTLHLADVVARAVLFELSCICWPRHAGRGAGFWHSFRGQRFPG